MFHIYTYGRGSRQFLILTPNQAKMVDLFTKQFFAAQKQYLEENEVRWTPDEPISLELPSRDWSHKYNKLVRWLNIQHKIRNWLFTLLRIDVMDEDMDDYLIKRF